MARASPRKLGEDQIWNDKTKTQLKSRKKRASGKRCGFECNPLFKVAAVFPCVFFI